jgi:hypothetical protein
MPASRYQELDSVRLRCDVRQQPFYAYTDAEAKAGEVGTVVCVLECAPPPGVPAYMVEITREVGRPTVIQVTEDQIGPA